MKSDQFLLILYANIMESPSETFWRIFYDSYSSI